jgi:hypothetical protein
LEIRALAWTVMPVNTDRSDNQTQLEMNAVWIGLKILLENVVNESA